MKKALLFIILIHIFSCEKSEKKIYIEELKWSLKIPNEFKQVPIRTSEITKEKGIKLIESAYPENKVKIIAKLLFNYNNGKFNSIKAQVTKLNTEQTLENEFKKVNEILIKSIIKKKPKAQFDTITNEETIGGLKFKSFNFKTINKPGKNYELKIYSRMFGLKKMDIIIVNNNKETKELIENRILNSKFE